MNGILVSISCVTYNHEKYIAQAIDSFLMQKTNFKYEILIHDDASTDRTAGIIKDYQRKYPDIIKPILQKENQKSKGFKRIGATFNYTRAKGKYIALCEGDDYWTDQLKLQKQVDFMVSHPECSMCFHAAEIEDATSKSHIGFIRPFNKTFVLPNDRIFLGGGHFCPTASILFVKKFMDNPPKLFLECPVGDHPLALLLFNQGSIGYINEVMAVRNLWVPNSWNTVHYQDPRQNKAKHLKELIKLLEAFNDYSSRRWEKEINKTLLDWNIKLLEMSGDLKPLKSVQCRNRIKELDTLDKVKLYARLLMPKLYGGFKDVRSNLRKNISKIEVEDSGKLKCKKKTY